MKFITVTTTGNNILCANMINSLRNHSDLPVVVYCADGAREELEFNHEMPDGVELRELNSDIKEHNCYGTDNFINISFKKIEALYNEIIENETGDFVLVDTDVVFMSDPAEQLLEIMRNTDFEMVFQTDRPTGQHICTGFFYVRNNDNVKNFLEEYLSVVPHAKETESHKTEWKEVHDQTLMNWILLEKMQINTKVKWTTFPTSFATNGHLYFSVNERHGSETVVHANFCVGQRDKLERLKTNNLWFMGDSDE